MPTDLAGKIVLVTGSSTGIGAALAMGFARVGADVAIHYHVNESAANQTQQQMASAGHRGTVFQGDLAKREGGDRLIAEVLAHYGRIDVLINNAGTLVRRTAASAMDDAYFDAVIGANLYSTVSCCRAVLPDMTSRGSGAIINVSSISGRNGGGPGATLYAAAKAAVATYTRGLAREVAPNGIRVNALSPGVVLTPFHDQFSTPETMRLMVATIPLGRAAAAEELVGPALFLASESMSGYITGQILEVNGGMYSP